MEVMSVSIVIPVYNEGEYLAACLNAIAAQTIAPTEVIVVDNNSTDGSIAIAESFSFVTLLREKRQGVVYARDRGFNAARGDIIGRIDADTIVDPSWVATLQQLFTNEPIDAVSGAVTYHDLPWRRFLGWLDLSFRQWIADGMGQEVFLYGSNMALRRSAWRRARVHVCRRAGLHEDFDLAIHLAAVGAHVAFRRQLLAAVSLRRFNILFTDYWQYVWLSPLTYRRHGSHAQRRMYPVVTLVAVNYLIIRLLYRSYDPSTGTLSLANIWTEDRALRVNPATFVD